MAIIPSPNTNYTDKDFDSIRDRLIALIRGVFPQWTDFNVSNFGNLLIELYAYVGDVLSYYQDNQSRESRLATATQRKNLINLAKMIGYSPSGATAATVDQTFTLAAPPIGAVIIPEGQVVKTADITGSVEFQLLEPLVIAAGANPPIAIGSVEHSKTYSDDFLSTGLANQELELGRTPYIDDTATVIDLSGSGWSQVSSLLNSSASDKHFTVFVDQNDRAFVRFGNGINGKIPEGLTTASYKTGGGSIGNVESGRISVFRGSLQDQFGNPVVVSTTNELAASGGADRETDEEIRQLAPLSLRALTRSVAREDFEINALRLPSVGRALMLTSNEDPAVEENTGDLYVIPVGGGVPSQALKDEVLAQFSGDSAPYPSTLTFQINVLDPSYLTIDVYAVLYVRYGYSPTTVAAQVRAALTEFFAAETSEGTPNPSVDFGFNYKNVMGSPTLEIPLSDIMNIVRDVDGIRKLGDVNSDFLVNGAHSDLPLGVNQFPQLGTVTLLNGDTGDAL